MDLRHLEQIVAITRCGGFSGAARRLGTSQPALSKSIGRLEAQLGVKLFDRDGGGARATALGQFLAHRAESLLKDVDDLGRDFARLVNGREGRLRIGVGPAPNIRFLGEVVAAMAERFPRLSIQTASDNAGRLVRDFVDGAYDAVFVHHEAATPFEDLLRIKVLEAPHVAITRPNHPVRTGRALTAPELLKYRIASATPSSDFVAWFGKVSGVEAENLKGFRSDSYDLIRDRVLHDGYIACAPAFVFAPDVASGRLMQDPLTWDGAYEAWMLTTRERWRSPEVKALADIARACGRKLAPAFKSVHEPGPLTGTEVLEPGAF